MNTRFLTLAAAVIVIAAGIAIAQYQPRQPQTDFHGQPPFGGQLDMPGRWQMIAQEDGTHIVLFLLNTNTGRVFRLQDAEDAKGGRGAWDEIRPQHARH